jgi:hypothetical protein
MSLLVPHALAHGICVSINLCSSARHTWYTKKLRYWCRVHVNLVLQTRARTEASLRPAANQFSMAPMGPPSSRGLLHLTSPLHLPSLLLPPNHEKPLVQKVDSFQAPLGRSKDPTANKFSTSPDFQHRRWLFATLINNKASLIPKVFAIRRSVLITQSCKPSVTPTAPPAIARGKSKIKTALMGGACL